MPQGWTLKEDSISTYLQSRFVGLTETVSCVRYRECSVLLRNYLDPVRRAVMCRRRRRAWPWRRSFYRSDGHGCERLIEGVGDEHSRHRVLLPAELREMHL